MRHLELAGRLSRIGVRSVALAGCFAAATAFAGTACYSIYSPDDKLVYQSTEAPVDTSLPYSQTVGAVLPGHHMVVTPADYCPGVEDAQVLRRLGITKSSGGVPPLIASARDLSDTSSGGGDGGIGVSPPAVEAGRSAGRDVTVRAYTKSDGTFVPQHTRSAPGRASGGTARR